MRSLKTVLWLGLSALVVPCFASCSHSVEGFCESWVEDTCQAITGCCQSGEKFDLEECRLKLSDSCQQGLALEKVHSGEAVFDSGAASDCAGQITTCADFEASQQSTFEHLRACANAVTGFRPPGAACDSSIQCQKAGDFATCYGGLSGSGSGVCAKVLLAEDNTCSFSFTTHELHACPDGTYCDTSGFEPDPSLPPEQRHFEFSAPCKTPITAGGKCIDVQNQQVLRCADGLYCDFGGASLDTAVCKARKPAGQSCQGSDECAAGLSCNYGSGGSKCGQGSLSYCYATSTCGDGTCDAGESSATCPQDCGSQGFCGDGVCDPGESSFDCPEDCNGSSCVDSCAGAITDGGDVCATSAGASAYDSLVSCALGACAIECSDLIQNQGVSSADCGSCLTTNCGTELTDCSNN